MVLGLNERRLTFLLQAILLVEMVASFWRGQWLTGVATTAIIIVTLTPQFLARRFRVHIPSQFQLMAIAFVFASLFLGEIRDYYGRFSWWDTALHTMSGFLLGIVGFLLVHVLNEVERVGVHMKPGFVAFFAFLFALGVGTLWELFEFAMDVFFGMNMQKPMFGDMSGLTDTMMDLLVDAIGALVISIMGYRHLKHGEQSFMMRWIAHFVERNPRLFGRSR